MGKMYDAAKTFHVALVKGVPLVVPSKAEWAERAGWVRPRLPLRGAILTNASHETARAFVWGWRACADSTR